LTSPPDLPPFAAVVLAAQRPGAVDPLAAEAGVSHKCLVPIGDAPLIVHVVRTLHRVDGLERLRIVVEPDAVDAVAAVLPAGGAAVEWVAAADNLADSVYAATRDLDQPTIVTTADNVLMTADGIGLVRATLAGGADVVVAMARKADVLAAHPEGQRRFYQFRDDAYSNCNLYAFSGRRTVKVAESFRSGGQFAKQPRRLLAAVGVLNVILMRFGRLSLAGAMARLSRRFGVTVAAAVIPDGRCAIDVDNRRTYDVAAQLLARGPAAG
jgi:GTP:adenosylcobinamide-phosphate guanylyltransferase